jgi:transposase
LAGRPVAVCVALHQGPLVYALQPDDVLVLSPVNPATLTKYRAAFCPSHAKDDPTDAELALEVLLAHRDQLHALHPQRAPMRTLPRLVEQRRALVEDTVRITTRLTATLKPYFPQVLDWCTDKNTLLCCDCLTRWPTLQQAQHARQTRLTAFFRDHHRRDPQLIEPRVHAILSTTALTADAAVISPNRLLVDVLVEPLRAGRPAVARFDREIAPLAVTLPDDALFSPLPGAGPGLAPRLLAAFGDQRERDPQAAAVQQYVGIAPVTERRGYKCWGHWRWPCPTFLRQPFGEWAAPSIPPSYWARAFDETQRPKGASHQAALRALAFTWSRILYRCWQDRTPDEEATYLNALQRRGSPLVR